MASPGASGATTSSVDSSTPCTTAAASSTRTPNFYFFFFYFLVCSRPFFLGEKYSGKIFSLLFTPPGPKTGNGADSNYFRVASKMGDCYNFHEPSRESSLHSASRGDGRELRKCRASFSLPEGWWAWRLMTWFFVPQCHRASTIIPYTRKAARHLRRLQGAREK